MKADDGSEAIFVHQSGTLDQVGANDNGSYAVEGGKKGLNAVHVKMA